MTAMAAKNESRPLHELDLPLPVCKPRPSVAKSPTPFSLNRFLAPAAVPRQRLRPPCAASRGGLAGEGGQVPPATTTAKLKGLPPNRRGIGSFIPKRESQRKMEAQSTLPSPKQGNGGSRQD